MIYYKKKNYLDNEYCLCFEIKKTTYSSTFQEMIIHVMDKKKKALKRAFPSDSGLTGCLKIKANYNQTTKNWMDSLKHHFRGNIDFIPHIMGRNGLEPISTDCSLEQIENMKIQKKSALKIYAMAKGKGNYIEHLTVKNEC